MGYRAGSNAAFEECAALALTQPEEEHPKGSAFSAGYRNQQYCQLSRKGRNE